MPLLFLSYFALGQTSGRADSLKKIYQQKKTKDSLRRVSIQEANKRRRDSVLALQQLRLAAAKKRRDSTAAAKRAERQAALKNKREYLNNKKRRAKFLDSLEKERAKSAAARKAYRKNLAKHSKTKRGRDSIAKAKEKAAALKKAARKKTINKLAKKKKEKPIKEAAIIRKKEKVAKKKKEKPIKTASKKQKKESIKKPAKKISKLQEKEQSKKPVKKKTDTRKKETAKKQAKEATDIRKKEREERRKEKTKKVVITKDKYNGNNYYQYELVRVPPEKKNTYLSFQLGHSNYLGDLGGNSGYGKGSFKDVSFKENTFMYGISLTHLRKEVLGLRFSYLFGNLAGSDKNTFFKSKNDPSYKRYIRNLDFRTTIREASLLLEVHPFKFFNYSKKLHNSYFQPYVIGGIGLFSFNPQGSYFDEILDDDVWIDLAPLRTEGQGMAEYPDRQLYKLTQFNIPLGFGFNYELSPSILTGLEFNGRLLFTDYLDDVSTNFINPNLYDNYLSGENIDLAKRLNNKSDLVDATKAYKSGQIRGNPDNNDFYFTISARLIIKLNRNKKPKVKKTEIFKFDDSEICD